MFHLVSSLHSCERKVSIVVLKTIIAPICAIQDQHQALLASHGRDREQRETHSLVGNVRKMARMGRAGVFKFCEVEVKFPRAALPEHLGPLARASEPVPGCLSQSRLLSTDRDIKV